MFQGFPKAQGLILAATLVLVASALAATPPFQRDRSVVANGGGPAAGSSYQSRGTLGQAGVGPVQGSQYQARLGYRTGSATTATAVLQDNPAMPRQYVLEQNHPNPFNPRTKISFALPSAGRVILVLHDARGRRVRTLVDADLTAGRHEVVLDARDLSSGVYWYTLQSGAFTQTRKLVLVK